MLKKLMKINLKVIGAILAILVLAHVITAYFFGVMAEKQFESQFKKITNSQFVRVVNYSYSRGWFTSSEDVTLELNNQGIKNALAMLPIKAAQESGIKISDNKYELKYTSSITNGIFAGWIHGNIMPTIAYSKTDLILPDSINSVLKTFFKENAPLELTTILYLNNSGKYKIFSPSFNYEEALSGVKVNWGGLKLDIAFNEQFNKFASNLDAPFFNLSAPTKGEFSFNGLKYSSNTYRSINDIKVGDAEFTLDAVKINYTESSSVNFKLGQIVNAVVGLDSVDFLNDIDVIDPTKMSLTKAHYSSHSADEDNYFSAHVVAGFENLTSVKESYGPLDFDFDLKHIRADKFSAVADLLASQTQLNESQQEAVKDKFIASLKENMAPILVESPVAQVNKLSLKVPSGLISINGLVTTHGFESADINDQVKFMNKIYADAHLAVPKPVLSYLLFLQMKYFLSAGNAQMDEQSSQALSQLVNILLDNQLQVWLKKGYMTQESSILSTNIKFESSVIYLNDKPTTSN